MGAPIHTRMMQLTRALSLFLFVTSSALCNRTSLCDDRRGCFKHSTTCEASTASTPFVYCPANDTNWSSKNPTWRECLRAPCYTINATDGSAVGNATCVKQCAKLW